ncbi:MAG: hypothetical protein KDA32_10950, partial [Phycisphaerales bacterium]|nr:hypothetical protein [Phycisphaerales bacterium]
MSQQYQPVLNLKKRPCKIGGSMSTTTEKHGDEDVGAINIAVDGITITRDELEALLGPGSFDAI